MMTDMMIYSTCFNAQSVLLFVFLGVSQDFPDRSLLGHPGFWTKTIVATEFQPGVLDHFGTWNQSP